MSDDIRPITVIIFNKEYVVGCKDEEREALFASVQYLNDKMNEQRDDSNVVGSESVAVMAALNITHEYLEFRNDHQSLATDVGEGIARMQGKIAAALSSDSAVFELENI